MLPIESNALKKRFSFNQSRAYHAKRQTHKAKIYCRKKSHDKSADAKWSGKLNTVSTYPPKDLYTQDAKTIARVMAIKKVSPKGIGSAIRMIQFYINRAGKHLPAARLREPEKAKQLLQEKNEQ